MEFFMKAQKTSFKFLTHLFFFIFFVFTLSSCTNEDLENIPLLFYLMEVD